MPKFRVSGDILHAGFVVVEANDEQDLIDKLHDSNDEAMCVGEFDIDDEQNRSLAFRWDGGDFDAVEDE